MVTRKRYNYVSSIFVRHNHRTHNCKIYAYIFDTAYIRTAVPNAQRTKFGIKRSISNEQDDRASSETKATCYTVRARLTHEQKYFLSLTKNN